MFKKILLVYSEKESFLHVNCYLKIQDYFKEKKMEVNYISIRTLEQFDFSPYDLVISFGGDGTFIRVSHYLRDLPILGINSEKEKSEGVLMELSSENISRLDEFFEGNFKEFFLDRIEVLINGRKISKLALNEIYFGSLYQFHTSRYEIEFSGTSEEQRSSGVLVSTSHGSGAWFKSAGGEPFLENDLKFIIREPYCSRVFSCSKKEGVIKENLKLVSKMHEKGAVVFDSNLLYEIKLDDEVLIRKSETPLRVLKLKN